VALACGKRTSGLVKPSTSPTSLGGLLHVPATRRVTNVRGQYT
jgi:hypothetical protein